MAHACMHASMRVQPEAKSYVHAPASHLIYLAHTHPYTAHLKASAKSHLGPPHQQPTQNAPPHTPSPSHTQLKASAKSHLGLQEFSEALSCLDLAIDLHTSSYKVRSSRAGQQPPPVIPGRCVGYLLRRSAFAPSGAHSVHRVRLKQQPEQ